MSRPRPKCLCLTTALAEAGGLADAAAGRRGYAAYLSWQAESGPSGKNKAYASLSRGWALGSREFKAALVKDHGIAAHARAWESAGAKEVRALQWERALARALRVVRHTAAEARTARKSANWKLAVAAWMKEHTQAGNPWLSEKLHLGAPAALSGNLTHYRRAEREKEWVWKLLRLISAAGPLCAVSVGFAVVSVELTLGSVGLALGFVELTLESVV